MASTIPPGNPLGPPPSDKAQIVDDSGRATTLMRQWMRGVQRILIPGINANVTLAKLTAGGTNGSLQVANGIIIKYTAPT